MSQKPYNHLTFYKPDQSNTSKLVMVDEGIAAGFPSPADDFKEIRISLDKTLIKNEDATFYARVRGESMINAGLNDGDLLVIDRSLPAENKKIAVCFIDGEFTVKRLKIEKDTITLLPENPKYQPIKVTDKNDFMIWGIVTYVVKEV